MKLMFVLSMPSNNAWNGRWSGEENLYARIVSLGTSKKSAEKGQSIIDAERFYHSFGDGWLACVMAKEATAKDVQRVKKLSRGFCGYDWMIDSIVAHGDIRID